MHKAIAFCRLIRLPNIASAASNILVGFLFVSESWQPFGVLAALLASSMLLYAAGMILNDFFDVEKDRAQSPQRPIPAGDFTAGQARMIGISFLGSGIAFALLAGFIANRMDSETPIFRPAMIAIVLAVAIILYDGPFKKMFFAPLIMGLCRTLNILLGMSVGLKTSVEASYLGFQSGHLYVALAIGVLICGITLLARRERDVNRRSHLVVAISIMVTGVGMLVLLPQLFPLIVPSSSPPRLINGFIIVMSLITLPMVGRSIVAARNLDAISVKRAVVSSLGSLVLIDAVLCWLAGGGQMVYPLIVAALMIPAWITRKWFATT